MRLPLWTMLVIALLAGQAHAQSSDALSSQGRASAGTIIDQPRGHPPAAGAAEGGATSIAATTSGPASSLRGAADGLVARSLAVAGRRLDQLWALLGRRDWFPPLLVLFNGLVAVFACLLWRSTAGLIAFAKAQSRDLKDVIVVAREAAEAANRSAEAASLQARAMVGTELPRLELGHVHLADADQSVRQALRAPSVELRFANYGRTTALVLEKCVEVRLGQTLPPDPAYDCAEALPVVEAVESGESVGAAAQRRLGELSESQIQGLLTGLNKLWVYGFVRFRDFLGMEHRLGFCLRWTPPKGEASIGGSFVQEDPGAYIYHSDDWTPSQLNNAPSPAARPPLDLRLAAAAE